MPSMARKKLVDLLLYFFSRNKFILYKHYTDTTCAFYKKATISNRETDLFSLRLNTW